MPVCVQISSREPLEKRFFRQRHSVARRKESRIRPCMADERCAQGAQAVPSPTLCYSMIVLTTRTGRFC